MSPELRQLRDVLDAQRAGVLKKLAGLSDIDARRSTVESGTSLAGLLQHLTFVESKWFEQIVAGRSATRGSRSMTVDPSTSLRTLRAEYHAACEASDEIIAAHPNADEPVQHNGKIRNLRWAILAVVEETARHAGIIREQSTAAPDDDRLDNPPGKRATYRRSDAPATAGYSTRLTAWRVANDRYCALHRTPNAGVIAANAAARR